MKKIILVFAAVAITAGVFAQTDSKTKKTSPADTSYGMSKHRDLNNQDMNSQNQNQNQNQNWQNNQQADKSHPDGVMMQNGKVMEVKDGEITALHNNEVTMSNGTKITSDGTIIKKDGSKSKMKEGQHMDMSGNMVPMKTNKDKDMYMVPDSTKK